MCTRLKISAKGSTEGGCGEQLFPRQLSSPRCQGPPRKFGAYQAADLDCTRLVLALVIAAR